ncbi:MULTISPECIES: 2Fe-2S iron-sulfur cluster-binding protein [Mesorhizobium]|uniref:2Fe-2S iron-sulfur cluster-binding protein n=1 Tax=Rhizobium loti TaxID=381 RepID=UPI001AECEF87
MNEDVLLTVLRSKEAEALLRIVPLDRAGRSDDDRLPARISEPLGSRLGCGEGMCHRLRAHSRWAGPEVPARSGPASPARISSRASPSAPSKAHAERGANGDVIRLSAIQQAFVEHFSFQCGYCTPGFVTCATVLVEHLMRKPVRRADVERTSPGAVLAGVVFARVRSLSSRSACK